MSGPVRRERLIDPFLGQVEEWVDRSQGGVRADNVHERLVVLGFGGDERTTPHRPQGPAWRRSR